MGGTYGRQVLDAVVGHPTQVTADGAPIWHPIGVTVDWSTVAAVEEDTALLDGTVIKDGLKYLRYGQVLVKDSGTGKWKPWSSGALKRGETVILNQTVLENGLVPGLTRPTSDHPPVFEGGLCWKARILAAAAGDEPVAQVETATVAGTITEPGSINVVITAAGMVGSPKTIAVAVEDNDTAAQVAARVRAALAADPQVSDFFAVSGSSTAVVMTKRTAEDNDATLNIALDTGTATGLTAAPTSANTTPGTDDLGIETGPAFANLEAALPLLRYV